MTFAIVVIFVIMTGLLEILVRDYEMFIRSKKK